EAPGLAASGGEHATDGAVGRGRRADNGAGREAAPDQADAESARSDDLSQALADAEARGRHLEQELSRTRAQGGGSAQTAGTLTATANAAARERDGLAQRLADADHLREVEASELRAQVATLEERMQAVDAERARYQRLAAAREAVVKQSIATL